MDDDAEELRKALSQRPGGMGRAFDPRRVTGKVMRIKDRQGVTAAARSLSKSTGMSLRDAISFLRSHHAAEKSLDSKESLEDAVLNESYETGVGLGEMTLIVLQEMKRMGERTDYHQLTDDEVLDTAENLYMALLDLCRANISPLQALRSFISCEEDDVDTFIERTRSVQLSEILRKVFP